MNNENIIMKIINNMKIMYNNENNIIIIIMKIINM